MVATTTGRGLTHTAWINAWTLHRACARLGVALHVPTDTPGFPLPVSGDPEDADWIFFTEEASLRRALSCGGPGRFFPEHFDPNLLDDKWALAEFLASDVDGPQGIPQWPLEAVSKACFPLLLKARHSWIGAQKLPRGWVCRTPGELSSHLDRLRAEGLTAYFFLQAWLGDTRCRLLSVGGFFDVEDETRNLALVTDRVATYGDGPNSSAMLVTVADDWGVVASTHRVLRRLHYRGPFEMEFLRVDGHNLIVELNPRFWMQHGLFLAVDNGLVKRYLGLDTMADRRPQVTPKLMWVDGTWLLLGLLRLDRKIWSDCWEWIVRRRHRPVICPTPGYLISVWLRRRLGRSA